MFERYTERARRVLFFARYEASQLGTASIGSEHLLLGLLRDGAAPGFSAQAFARAGLDYLAVRKELAEAMAGHVKIASSVEMPFAPAAKAALDAAAREADGLKHSHIGTEHLLLALLHESGTFAAGILSRAGLRLDPARESARLTSSPGAPEPHIVLVQVTIRPEMQAEFEAALLHNARESLRHDPGCLRFDVSQDKEQPTRWVLYEVYDGPEAHALHRQAAHFLAYDAVAARAVVEKTVAKCSGRFVT
jgi:ATP-dependent Clp protease ATP-binding subunit ClpC